NILRPVEEALQKEMEGFVADRLGATNVLKTFLAQYPDASAAQKEIVAAHTDATPRLGAAAASATEISIVSVPAESVADEFRQLVRQALPKADVTSGPAGD